MQPLEIFIKNLGTYLDLNDISDYQIAKKAGLNQGQISKIRNGQNKSPGIDVLTKIADAIGLSLLQLLDDGSGNGKHNEQILNSEFVSGVVDLLAKHKLNRPTNSSDQKSYINMADASDDEIEAMKDRQKAKRLDELEPYKNRKLPNQFTHSTEQNKKTREQLITEIITGLPTLDYDELNSISSSVEVFISTRSSKSATTLAE